MARTNNRPLIIGAAVLGLVGLLLTLRLLTSGGSGPATPGGDGPQPLAEQPKGTQFVARRDISPRTRLNMAMFDVQEIPKNEIPAGAITDRGQIENKLASAPIYRGQVLTGERTTAAITRVVPANIEIPMNTRAVAIWVNPDQTAAGLVDVGDHVDVIATHRFTLSKDEGTRITGATQITTGRVIAQDLLVLGVDSSIKAPPAAPAAAPGGDPNTIVAGPGAPAGQAPAPAPTPPPPAGQEARIRVVVAALPQVAARLVAAEEEGKLHVVIRNPASKEAIFQVPEAREYPSRIVAAPPPRSQTAATNAIKDIANVFSGSSSRRNRSNGDSDMSGLGMPMPSIPSPATSNIPPLSVPPGNMNSGGNNSGGSGALPAPNTTNEVTVIRGTEKTRVIVPR